MSARMRRARAKRRRHGARRATPKRRLALVGGLGLGAALGLGSTAQADVDVITVTSTADPGDGTCDADCTLREAITESDDGDATDVDRIVFQSGLSGTITLNGTQLPTIHESLTIEGPGADTLTVSGEDSSRILNAFSLGMREVTVSGLTLRDAKSPSEFGGAITTNVRDLTLREVTVVGSSAPYGGGVAVIGQSGSEATIESSTISGNTSPSGGGIFWYAGDATLRVENSTISGNSASGEAGGGGGILAFGGSLLIEDSTISGNSASGLGGGVAEIAGTTTLSNTIVANNTAAVGAGPDLAGSFDAAFSLVENTSGPTINETVPGSNLLGVDPELGPLQDNGGPTETQRPKATSPAVDQGSAGATTDQRGLPRPLDLQTLANATATGADGADIGAVELTAKETGLRCAGKRATIIANRTVTKGTAKRDVIYGRAERDVIRGAGGNDLVCAGGGNDKVIGGPGKDTLGGAKGKDTLKGGKGDDGLRGGPGRDRLFGGPGDDLLLGGPGPDHLAGGKGQDQQRQ